MPWRVFVLLVCTPVAAAPQGLPFHTETALTTAFEERGVRTFGSAQSRGDVDVFVSPLVFLPYAPHQRVTIKVSIPLLHKRLRREPGSPYSKAGIGDLTIGMKWAIFAQNRREGTTRLAVAGTVSLPTGSSDATFDDGVTAPRPLQLGRGVVAGGITLIGTRVHGQWGLSADVGHARSAGDDGFRFGSETRYDLAIGFRLPRYVQTIRTQTVQF